MNIFILRHGEAELYADSDSERHLTAEGKSDLIKVAGWLKQNGETFNAVLASPYNRTQESAKVLISELNLNIAIELERLLEPASEPSIAAEYCRNYPSESLILVSHMPLVSYLLADFSEIPERIGFGTATIAKISGVNGFSKPKLEYLLSPHQIR